MLMKKSYTSFWIVLTNHGANELQCYIFSMFKSFLKVYLLINRNVESDLPLCQYSVRVLALLSLCLLSHFSPLKIRMREDAEMQRTGNFPVRSEFPWQYHPAIPTQHRIILQYQHNTVSSCNTNTTQHHHPISTLFCSIYTRQQHLSILTQHTIVITTWTQYNIVLRYKHNTILQYQNNILS